MDAQESVPEASVSEASEKPKGFRWNARTVAELIDCIANYKPRMEYKHLDFDADKPCE